MTRFIKRGGKIWIRVFPDKPITKKPQETRMGKGKGAPEEWVCGRQARPHPVRDGRRDRDRGAARRCGWRRPSCRSRRKFATRFAAGEERHEGRRKLRELAADELRQREQDLDDQLFRLRIQKSMGQLEAADKMRALRRDLRAHQDGAAREGRQVLTMAAKHRKLGIVVSDKMHKSVVVAIERQVREGSTARPQRTTSTFMAHDEKNEAKVGDTRRRSSRSRPLSRRKRWVRDARSSQKRGGVGD